jgi:hypothetical protein
VNNDDFHYRFETDKGFMEWLTIYNPLWDCQYSGNLEALYEAYLAGAKTARLVAGGRYENAVRELRPLVYFRCE